MNRYNLRQISPTGYVTIKQAAELFRGEISVHGIRQAGYAGRIDMVRAGQGGWSVDRKNHNEVCLQSLWEYLQERDPRGRQLRNVSGWGDTR